MVERRLVDENSPLTSSATAGPRGVIAGWPPAPPPPSPGPSIAYPPPPPHQTNPKPHPPPPPRHETRNPTPPRHPEAHEGSGAGALPPPPSQDPSPPPVSSAPCPPPPTSYILTPYCLPPSFPPSQHENAESAPIAYAYRVPRGPNPPRETKQSTIVPAPHKQSTPKPISFIDPPHPPPSFLRRQESIPPECPPPAEPGIPPTPHRVIPGGRGIHPS